jgi:tRNA/rRNA methyltransferase
VGRQVDPFRFVLVEPRSAGNVGAAARALKNLGCSRLVLVEPACDHLGPQARMMAVEAANLLEQAAVHPTLDAALCGAGAVVGTSRRTGKHRRPHYRLDELAGSLESLARGGEIALVFGREDRGLTDLELDLCTHLVHLPAADAYPSFNLAQAVLVVAYELRRASWPAHAPAGGPRRVAEHSEREAMYRHLQQALHTIGYLHADSVEPLMRRLRRMLGRADMTAEEVRLLRGVARQVLWAARRAGLTVAGGATPLARGRRRADPGGP